MSAVHAVIERLEARIAELEAMACKLDPQTFEDLFKDAETRPEYWKAKLEWEEKDHAQDRTRIAELEQRNAELNDHAMECSVRAAQAERERDDWRTDARNYALRSGQAEERVRVLEEAIALLTIRTASGQLCFRTSGGIPMGMPKKQERRVEALLPPPAEQPTTVLAVCNKCGFGGQAELPWLRHEGCNYSAIRVPEPAEQEPKR